MATDLAQRKTSVELIGIKKMASVERMVKSPRTGSSKSYNKLSVSSKTTNLTNLTTDNIKTKTELVAKNQVHRGLIRRRTKSLHSIKRPQKKKEVDLTEIDKGENDSATHDSERFVDLSKDEKSSQDNVTEPEPDIPERENKPDIKVVKSETPMPAKEELTPVMVPNESKEEEKVSEPISSSPTRVDVVPRPVSQDLQSKPIVPPQNESVSVSEARSFTPIPEDQQSSADPAESSKVDTRGATSPQGDTEAKTSDGIDLQRKGPLVDVWRTTVLNSGLASRLKRKTAEQKRIIEVSPLNQFPAYRKGSLPSSASTRATIAALNARRRSIALQEMKEAAQKKERIRRLRRNVNVVIFCIRCVKQHTFNVYENSEITPFVKTLSYLDMRADEIEDLMFDPSNFRADRQLRISEETKRILSSPPCERTETEIYSVMIALRNIHSFAVYPARMQRKLAEVGQYENYEARRVITREGHPAAAFYFILSGAVLAMRMDDDRIQALAVGEFVKGDCFEDAAMIEGRRQCTVLTKENCELFSISNKDYRKIFMSDGQHNINDPDQEHFIRKLNFLTGWPLKMLETRPDKCQFLYFKRGDILAKDTSSYDWIVIVKSGSLRVLKKLKKVGPYEWRHRNALKPLTERERRERKEQKSMWRRFVLPELGLPLRDKGEVEEVEERVDGKPKPFKHPQLKLYAGDDQKNPKGSKMSRHYPNLWRFKASGTNEDETEGDTAFSNINQQFLYMMKSTPEKDQDRSTPQSPPKSLPPSRQRTYASLLSNADSADSKQNSATPSPDQNSTFGRHLQSILDELDSGYLRKDQPAGATEADVNPQFVRIQTLTKGQVWGLADMVIGDQPSFCIVSNGADCILLNKHFYLEHASEKLVRRLRQDLCPYPTEDELQQELQATVDWKAYRKTELFTTMDELYIKKEMRSGVMGTKVQESY